MTKRKPRLERNLLCIKFQKDLSKPVTAPGLLSAVPRVPIRATKTNKSICYASLTQQLSLCCSLMLFGIRRELRRQLAAHSQSQARLFLSAGQWLSFLVPAPHPTHSLLTPKVLMVAWRGEQSRQYLQKWPQGRGQRRNAGLLTSWLIKHVHTIMNFHWFDTFTASQLSHCRGKIPSATPSDMFEAEEKRRIDCRSCKRTINECHLLRLCDLASQMRKNPSAVASTAYFGDSVFHGVRKNICTQIRSIAWF